jgi:phage gp36-like protein
VPYSVLADLQSIAEAATLVDLTDDTGTGVVDAAKVARAIADADSVIDAHLRAHYVVPLANAPAFVRTLSCDLALFNLFSRRPSLGIPDTIATRKKDALTHLAAVRDGKLDLGIEPPPAASSAEVATYAEGEDQLFTSATLETF